MHEKISIKQLTAESAIISKNKYITYEDQEIPVGDTWQRAYVNSDRGRADAAKEVPEPYLSAIMTVWGDTPTIMEDFPGSGQ